MRAIRIVRAIVITLRSGLLGCRNCIQGIRVMSTIVKIWRFVTSYCYNIEVRSYFYNMDVVRPCHNIGVVRPFAMTLTSTQIKSDKGPLLPACLARMNIETVM